MRGSGVGRPPWLVYPGRREHLGRWRGVVARKEGGERKPFSMAGKARS
jgi:hypothetical protein